MAYLSPAEHRLWKTELLLGRSDPSVAEMVGDKLGRIHSAFSQDPAAPDHFPRDDIFYAIRLEPYLVATGRAHPGLSDSLQALVERTLSTKRSVVHGDISPKNILIGPHGPVFLDAECAWFGDPAFDVAFCLNHLLLKCVASPQSSAEHLAGFDALRQAYLARVKWESADALEARAASLLPGLFLARVDGKSPVEYLTDEADKEAVRRVSIPLIRRPPERLAALREAWANDLRMKGLRV
jgi:aminoglycoside phosphotransferase (APT) family kinase protein